MKSDEIRIVANDLDFLRRWGSDIDEDDIRRGSAVLRRLLVEDAFGKAWRAVGESGQPSVVAIDISHISPADVIYAIAAGANFRGVDTACMFRNNGTRPIGDFGPPITEGGYPGESLLSLSEFLSSPSGYVGGRTFSRRDVIKYISNVRGGVHLGQSEKKAEKKLIARIGKIEDKLQVHNTDALLVEILAIGQALARAEDSDKFVRLVQGT